MPLPQTELERLVSRELLRLPPPRAPRSLLPRVMTAVRGWSDRPWYAREWFAWPVPWQIASAAGLLLLMSAAGVLLHRLEPIPTPPMITPAVELLRNLEALARVSVAMAGAVATVWRALLDPLVAYIFVLVMLLCLACASFAHALSRLALGRAMPV